MLNTTTFSFLLLTFCIEKSCSLLPDCSPILFLQTLLQYLKYLLLYLNMVFAHCSSSFMGEIMRKKDMEMWVRAVTQSLWKKQNHSANFLRNDMAYSISDVFTECVKSYSQQLLGSTRVASLCKYASSNCSCNHCPVTSLIHPLISQILIKYRHRSMKFFRLHLYFQSDDSEVTYFNISSRISMVSHGGSIFLLHMYYSIDHKLEAEVHRVLLSYSTKLRNFPPVRN